MKKKILVILLCMLSIGLLSGCGNDNPADEMVQKEPANSVKIEEKEEKEEGSKNFSTLSKLHESVKEEMGERYWPETFISETELEEKTGITPDMYIEFIAEKNVMDSDIDTMIIIHAKEEYVGNIETSLEAYRSNVILENQEYPQNYGKAQASRMETIENYVCFVQLGADTTTVADKGEEEIIAYCQEENERALHILEKEILE